MAAPVSEWMQWAKRFQLEHTLLLRRVRGTEELIARVTSLEEGTEDLAASNKHLQDQNNVLKDRVRQLKDDAGSRESAKGETLKRLEAKVASLENTINRLLRSEVTRMKDVCARCDETEKEIQRLKARIEEPKDFVQAGRPSRAASPRPSQVTTEDENMQIDEDHRAKLKDPLPPDTNIVTQGDEPLEEYVRYGKSFLAQEIQRYDSQAAKAFVSGMKSIYYRITLWEKLDEIGWSTRSAIEEAHRMIEDGKRRKKRKERLMEEFRRDFRRVPRTT